MPIKNLIVSPMLFVLIIIFHYLKFILSRLTKDYANVKLMLLVKRVYGNIGIKE
jgi:hypothetical protein